MWKSARFQVGLFVLGVSAAMPGQEPAQEQPEHVVEVISLTVSRTPRMAGVLPRPGSKVIVELAVKVPGKAFFEVDPVASSLVTLADDTGEQLKLDTKWLTYRRCLRRDTCILTIRSCSAPARNARQILCRGTLVLVESGPAARSPMINIIAKGVKFPAGPTEVVVSELGSDGKSLSLTCRSNVSPILRFEFRDKAGRSVAAAVTKHTFVDSVRISLKEEEKPASTKHIHEFAFQRAVKGLTVVAVYRSAVKEVLVPIDLKVGTGL